jgi:hypothetical protein
MISRLIESIRLETSHARGDIGFQSRLRPSDSSFGGVKRVRYLACILMVRSNESNADGNHHLYALFLSFACAKPRHVWLKLLLIEFRPSQTTQMSLE